MKRKKKSKKLSKKDQQTFNSVMKFAALFIGATLALLISKKTAEAGAKEK